jgi:hypothetical protein
MGPLAKRPDLFIGYTQAYVKLAVLDQFFITLLNICFSKLKKYFFFTY